MKQLNPAIGHVNQIKTACVCVCVHVRTCDLKIHVNRNDSTKNV